MYRNRRILGSDYGEPIAYDPITGEPLVNDSYYSEPDTGAPVPVAPVYQYSFLSDANLKSYFETFVWPQLKRAATEGEIDDVMIGAHTEITNLFPMSSMTAQDAETLSHMVDQYTQRAKTFLATGQDPWAISAKVPGGGKTMWAIGIAGAAIVAHRLFSGDWIWEAYKGWRW